MLTRRKLLTQGALVTAAAFAGPGLMAQVEALAAPAAAKRPNVLLIYTDDQNPDTIACFGGDVVTPNIDRLAREGVRFTKSFVTSSVCTPSRYSCITGRYASRCDAPAFLNNFPGDAQANIGFNTSVVPGKPSLATMLRDAGYHTAFAGKWHTGGPRMQQVDPAGKMDDPAIAAAFKANHEALCQYIRSCGFDHVERVYRGNVEDHKLKDFNVHNPEWLTEGVLNFLAQRDTSKPFFMWYCPTLQHSPWPMASLKNGDWRKTPAGLLSEPPAGHPSRESILRRVTEARSAKPELAAAALWLDDSVGAILQKLEQIGELDNTLILYMSDNCTRAGKGTCYDDGANTPFVARWPGHIAPGSVRDELVRNIDLVPTVLEACGVPVAAQASLDGQSLLPLFAGETTRWPNEVLLEVGFTRAYRDERWKYIAVRYPPSVQQKIDDGTLETKPYHMDTALNLQQNAERGHACYWDVDQLYDLSADPREQRNLARDPKHAQPLTRMKARLSEKLKPLGRRFGEFV